MKKILISSLIALLIVSPLSAKAESFKVTGNSMLPMYKNGDIVDLNKEKGYKDGDVVIAELKDGKKVVKRLQGNVLVGDNHKGSINIPLTEVKSIIGKPMENTDDLTDDDIKAFEEVFAAGIKQVLSGGNTAGALSDTGELFMWGYNGNGQVGNGSASGSNILKPVKVLTNVIYADISVTGNTAGAIVSNGDLYMWGYNAYGQVTKNITVGAVYTPTKVMSDVKQFSLGNLFSTAITKNNDLYVWGYNDEGQLGRGSVEPTVYTPTLVLSDIKQVSAGTSFVGALTNSGDLFMWGNNYDGQVGNGGSTGDIGNRVSRPRKTLSNVKSIDMGSSHSSAITNSNDLYVWGENITGAVGDGTTFQVSTPKKILSNVKKASAGQRITSAITYENSLYMWGTNDYGQLGLNSTTSQRTPQLVQTNISDIGLGQLSTIAISTFGELFVWGQNESGVLGIGSNVGTVRYNTPTALDSDFIYSNRVISNTITGVIYLPVGAPILENYTSSISADPTGTEVLTRISGGFTIYLAVVRYTPPTTIGNLNIN